MRQWWSSHDMPWMEPGHCDVRTEQSETLRGRRMVLEAEHDGMLDWTEQNLQSAEYWCHPDRFPLFEQQMRRSTITTLELARIVLVQATGGSNE